MLERIISLKDLAKSRLTAKSPATRLVKFPDGVTRHITLPGWQWAALDRFDRENIVLKSDEIIGLAFESAQADTRDNDVPFEEALRRRFSKYLAEGFCFSSDYVRGYANDC